MEREIDWAVVVPTWREEGYIGRLLDSLAGQTVSPKEIVVVDASSDDGTIEEITSKQAQLPQMQAIQVPRSTIAKQRNIGVFHTKSPHILFLDADTVPEKPRTLEQYRAEVERRKPDIALAETRPLSDDIRDKIYYKALFWYLLKVSFPFYPLATAMNLYVKREAFERLGGFNEEIYVGEDHQLLQRMVKTCSEFAFLDNPKFDTSIRRIIKEGRLRLFWKLAVMGWQTRGGNFARISGIDYTFGDYGNMKK